MSDPALPMESRHYPVKARAIVRDLSIALLASRSARWSAAVCSSCSLTKRLINHSLYMMGMFLASVYDMPRRRIRK